MDLRTRYLGFDLPHPVFPGSSPLADDLDGVRQLEDAGAAAIVLRSLFVEQVEREHPQRARHLDVHGPSFAEATAHFPPSWRFAKSTDDYLDHVRLTRATTQMPVIASFNIAGPGPWLDHVAKLAQAGADAIELNVYAVASDPATSGATLEAGVVDAMRAVRAAVTLPIAVKLLPFYSALPHLARQLAEAGANGLVLFNRFLQPDIDVKARTLVPAPPATGEAELRLRLRWLALLHGRTPLALSASGGVQNGISALKAILAGADTVQMVSALLARGPYHLKHVVRQLSDALEEGGWDSLAAARGAMSLAQAPDPAVHERAYYMTTLQTRRGD